jgi:hypothetical protein
MYLQGEGSHRAIPRKAFFVCKRLAAGGQTRLPFAKFQSSRSCLKLAIRRLVRRIANQVRPRPYNLRVQAKLRLWDGFFNWKPSHTFRAASPLAGFRLPARRTQQTIALLQKELSMPKAQAQDEQALCRQVRNSPRRSWHTPLF